jgi:hypothetical protein
VSPSSRIVSKIQMSHETAIKVTEECTYHGEESNIHVCKSVAEESRKSYVLDRALSGGLCGMVSVVTDVTATQRHVSAGKTPSRGII